MRKSFVEKRKTRVQGPVIEVTRVNLDMLTKNEPVRYVELPEKTNDNTRTFAIGRPVGVSGARRDGG